MFSISGSYIKDGLDLHESAESKPQIAFTSLPPKGGMIRVESSLGNCLINFFKSHPKIFAIITSSLIATVIGLIFRCLFLAFCGVDIINIFAHPYLAGLSCLSINSIRFALRFYLESLLIDKPLIMSSLGPGSGSNSPAPSSHGSGITASLWGGG